MATKTIRAETVAQAYLEILRERGVEYFFANAGTDFASLVDGFARLAAEGKTTPRPMAVPHEFVAVSMAHGYYAVTGRPQVVMVHVTVGTANALGAVRVAHSDGDELEGRNAAVRAVGQDRGQRNEVVVGPNVVDQHEGDPGLYGTGQCTSSPAPGTPMLKIRSTFTVTTAFGAGRPSFCIAAAAVS